MIEASAAEGAVEALLVLVLMTGAFIVTRKDLISLLSTYRIQSLLLVLLAVSLYASGGTETLLYLAALTLVSKVVIIPYAIGRIQKSINIQRDLEFHYLSPAGSIIATMVLILLTYTSFSRIVGELSLGKLFYLGAVFGVSLMLMGMLIIFSRRKVITKIVGYLTMENGVLLFSLFITELPFMIEVWIMIDLLMLVMLAVVLSIGIDASVEEFQDRLHPFHHRKEDK